MSKRPSDEVLQPKPGYSYNAKRLTTPGNYYALAEDYLDAATVLFETPAEPPRGALYNTVAYNESPPRAAASIVDPDETRNLE